MLRITTLTPAGAPARLRIEGRIAADTLAELNAAAEPLFAVTAGLLLDLAGVRFVDAAGARTLAALERRGAVLVGLSAFLRELLAGARRRDSTGAQGEGTELLFALRANAAEAREQLVRRHGGRMLRTARRLLGTERDAREAVQDALLAAVRSAGSFPGTTPLFTWLRHLVVGAALAKLRAQHQHPEEPIDELLPRFAEDGHFAGPVSRWATEPALERLQPHGPVQRSIERLPRSYRTILMLSDVEDLGIEDVATALGITPNAAKIRVHRARQALRTQLETELMLGARVTGV